MAITFRYELPEIMKIGTLKSRIVLCSQEDVVVDNGVMQLVRKGIRTCWARIDERRGSLPGPNGLTVGDLDNQQSHIITTRYMWDIDVRTTAWIYDCRLRSPPRWFKVYGVADSRLAYQFACRMVERGDEASQPVAVTGTEQSIFAARPMPRSQ